EIVHHIEVGPPVAVEITPAATEAVTCIVLIEPGFRGYIVKGPVALVAHHEVGRAVLGVIVRRRILVLIGALILDIEAKVNVEPPIAIIVGNRCPGESTLRRACKTKRIWLLTKLPTTLVEK